MRWYGAVLVAVAVAASGGARAEGVRTDAAPAQAAPTPDVPTSERSRPDPAGPSPEEPVRSTARVEVFPKLFETIDGDAAAQSAYRSCPADIFGKGRPFWRRWWDDLVGDTDLSLELCGEDPARCLWLCLSMKGADACFTTARVLQDNAEPKDQGDAQALFAQACALGYPAGCTNRGAGVKNGGRKTDPFPDPDEPKTALCLFRSFKTACDQDDAWACTMHGMSYQYGEGVSVDEDRAKAAYAKACAIDPDFVACEMAQDELKAMTEPAPDGEAAPK